MTLLDNGLLTLWGSDDRRVVDMSSTRATSARPSLARLATIFYSAHGSTIR